MHRKTATVLIPWKPGFPSNPCRTKPFYSHALAEAEARAENAEQMLADALKQQQARARARTPAWRNDLVQAALDVADALEGSGSNQPLPKVVVDLIQCASVYRERQAGTGAAVPESAPVDSVEPPEHPAR